MWDLPRPGLDPVSPALAGGFLTTAPPGRPPIIALYRSHPPLWSYPRLSSSSQITKLSTYEKEHGFRSFLVFVFLILKFLKEKRDVGKDLVFFLFRVHGMRSFCVGQCTVYSIYGIAPVLWTSPLIGWPSQRWSGFSSTVVKAWALESDLGLK